MIFSLSQVFINLFSQEVREYYFQYKLGHNIIMLNIINIISLLYFYLLFYIKKLSEILLITVRFLISVFSQKKYYLDDIVSVALLGKNCSTAVELT